MDKRKIITIINEYWKMIPKENLPTYEQFNAVLPVGDNRDKFLALEEKYPKIGVAKIDDPDQTGITVLSLIATITDLLGNFRLAAMLDERGYIVGWSIYNDQLKAIKEQSKPKQDGKE